MIQDRSPTDDAAAEAAAPVSVPEAVPDRWRPWLPRHRRLVQLFFLAVFFGLLTLTVWPLGRVFLGVFLVADPLIAINSLVNGVLRWEMLLALVVLLTPLLLGRAFCGYVCPMGTLIELLGPRSERRRAGPLLRQMPVFVLIACLGLLLFGSGLFLIFDPLVMLTRSATTLLYPLLDRTIRLAGDVGYLVPGARGMVDVVTGVLAGRLVFPRPLFFQLQFVILVMTAAVFAISWVERRMWCRHLCPLGALLGLVSRGTLLGRTVDDGLCIRCGRCASACPLAAIVDDPTVTDPTRCELGFECAEVCPTGAVGFGRRTHKVVHDPGRRALLGAGGAALAGGFFLYTGRARAAAADTFLVRPPGARDEETFLALCSRCAQCMKVCPTNVLQPALGGGAGWEGVFTPRMDFRHGSCDWSCNECGKVCPTGAIEPLSLDEKRQTVIGRAYIDRDRCIPWADLKDCLVCQELCPTPEKAIVLQPETLTGLDRGRVTVKRPWVVADRCIGCGICENACPVVREAAIRVRAPEQAGRLTAPAATGSG